MGATLVTGAAGFIGAHVCQALLARGERVIGLDNLNAYYEPALKEARLAALTAGVAPSAFDFHKLDLADHEAVLGLMRAEAGLNRVVHLGAQAGVRWSLEQPFAYTSANVTGQLAILEGVRRSMRQPVRSMGRAPTALSGRPTGPIIRPRSTPPPSWRAN
jgi:UDP-glucuronate 4-epimerase